MKTMFGVNTPISTPMHDNQEIDYAGLKNLCEYLIEKGIHGLYPNGSTGEMAYLTLDERKKVLECCVETSNGRAQVFSMVGAPSTRDTIELARHAADCGADGIGVVTPYYFKLSDAELVDHFVAVARSVPEDFAIYLYGIPQLAVNDITPNLAEQIVRQAPNVIGIKYSFPDMPRLLKFTDVNEGRFSVLAGPDDLFYLMLCGGGDGTISGNSNVIPELFVAVYDAFRVGDHARAARLQHKVNRLIDHISGPKHMARYKVGLVHRGIIKSAAVRSPLVMLSDAEARKYLDAIEALDYQSADV